MESRVSRTIYHVRHIFSEHNILNLVFALKRFVFPNKPFLAHRTRNNVTLNCEANDRVYIRGELTWKLTLCWSNGVTLNVSRTHEVTTLQLSRDESIAVQT